MPVFFSVYLVLAVISIIINSVTYSKGKDKNGLFGLVLCLTAGLVLFLGFLIRDPSSVSGHYITKVNGVRVSSGSVSFFSAFAIGLLGAAFPNLLGMSIGYSIFKGKKPGKEISLFAKIVCVFLLMEASGVLIMAFTDNTESNALAFVFASLIFLIPGLLLLVKWVKKNGK